MSLLVPKSKENDDTLYASTDRGTCIDWCIGNNQPIFKDGLTIYENWFSDHKALWLELQKNDNE